MYGRSRAVRTWGAGQFTLDGHCCTCTVRVPASGVPYVPRTVAPQEVHLTVAGFVETLGQACTYMHMHAHALALLHVHVGQVHTHVHMATGGT